MRISWKYLGLAGGLVVAMVGSQPINAKRPMDIFPCRKSSCSSTSICGQTTEVPKLCGPTKDGPWTESTHSCCCCVDGGQNSWFWGG
jgi:hypothetical protein